MLLALLKRHLCPSCRLLSLDPGGYRRVVGQPHDCAERSLRWAGLMDEVELVEDIGGVASFELPVGFVYLDDGKTRFSNDPLLAYEYAAPRMMLGAVLCARVQEVPHGS